MYRFDMRNCASTIASALVLVGCVSNAPSDAASPASDGGHDAARTDASDTDAASVDAEIDAGRDAGDVDAGAVLAHCSASEPCEMGECQDGICASFEETVMPYRYGRCELWTSDPPPSVRQFAFGAGGLWAAGSRFVLRLEEGDRWALRHDPSAIDFDEYVRRLASGPDYVAIQIQRRSASGIRLRYRDATGVWADLTPPATPVDLYGGGSTLYRPTQRGGLLAFPVLRRCDLVFDASACGRCRFLGLRRCSRRFLLRRGEQRASSFRWNQLDDVHGSA